MQSFLMMLSSISRGSMQDKLTWTFDLYDIDRRGKITRSSMKTIFVAVNQMLGNGVSIAVSEVLRVTFF